jgi:hypothetical protein
LYYYHPTRLELRRFILVTFKDGPDAGQTVFVRVNLVSVVDALPGLRPLTRLFHTPRSIVISTSSQEGTSMQSRYEVFPNWNFLLNWKTCVGGIPATPCGLLFCGSLPRLPLISIHPGDSSR